MTRMYPRFFAKPIQTPLSSRGLSPGPIGVSGWRCPVASTSIGRLGHWVPATSAGTTALGVARASLSHPRCVNARGLTRGSQVLQGAGDEAVALDAGVEAGHDKFCKVATLSVWRQIPLTQLRLSSPSGFAKAAQPSPTRGEGTEMTLSPRGRGRGPRSGRACLREADAASRSLSLGRASRGPVGRRQVRGFAGANLNR